MSTTTTTSWVNQIPTEVIDPLVLSYLRNAVVVTPMVRTKDLSSTPGLTANFNSFGQVSAGSKVEGVDFTPVELTIAQDGTVTAAEVGLAIDVSDIAIEATQLSLDDVAREIANATAEKMEVDICAGFADFVTTKGTSGQNLTIAVFEDAILALRQAKAPTAPQPDSNLPPQFAGYFGVFAESGVAQLERSIRQSGIAVMSPSTTEMLETFGQAAAAAARFRYLGVNVFGQDLVPAANGDRSGAILCPAAIGLVTKRAPRIENARHAIGTSTYLVGSAVYGADVIKNAFGVEVVHKA